MPKIRKEQTSYAIRKLGTDADNLQIRYGTAVTTPNASGDGTITFSTPFPTGYITICFSNGDRANSPLQIVSQINYGNSAASFDYHAFLSTTGAAITVPIRVNYIAIGN